jgi:hypothetical protein
MVKKIQKNNLLIFILVAGVLALTFAKVFDTYLMLSVPIVANPTPDSLESELSVMISHYENAEISVIKLSDVTTFSWDKVYFFGPYTPLSSLEHAVGRSWRNICFTQIDTLEGYTLLVFTNKQKVVHCLEYPIDDFNFSSLAKYSSGLLLQDALFISDEKGKAILAGDR